VNNSIEKITMAYFPFLCEELGCMRGQWFLELFKKAFKTLKSDEYQRLQREPNSGGDYFDIEKILKVSIINHPL